MTEPRQGEMKQAYELIHGRITLDGVDYLAPATVMLDDADAATMLAQGTIRASAPAEEPAKAAKKQAPAPKEE